MFKKTKKGFTIVELVIVIAVIGILSAILIPTFANLTNQAKDTALRSNLANAYSMYASDAADGKSDKDESKTIKFVGQAEVFLIDKGATSVTSATEGYMYDGEKNEWKIDKVAFSTFNSTATPTFVVAGDAASSLFGDYIVCYGA